MTNHRNRAKGRLRRREFCRALGASSAALLGGARRTEGRGRRPAVLDVQIDWAEFLGRHDLIWDEEAAPRRWEEGAFLGNGLLGAMIVRAEDDRALRWTIGRSDVTDHAPRHAARLPIGEIELHPVGRIRGGRMRLDLWNAEARGALTTEHGDIAWRSFVHAAEHVLVVEIDPSEGEAGCGWRFRPSVSISPRAQYRRNIDFGPPNQPAVIETITDAEVCTQRLIVGGEYATAWREVSAGDFTSSRAPRRTLYLTVGYSHPRSGGKREAWTRVRGYGPRSLARLARTHRAWWHDYYPSSFLSLPDARLESFYWIQMYKLGSATRADRPALDLMGPWFRHTPWAQIWWNLNIQLAYWPVYAANRIHLGESLCRMLDRNRANLIENAPAEMRHDSARVGRATSYDCRDDRFEKNFPQDKELGNLTWACHNYWLQYRYSMDERLLRDRLLPLLRRSVNYYLHLLERGADGRLHTQHAISPEYPQEASDTNYDLALVRWGCRTLLAACERLRIADPLIPRWRAVLRDLAPYPADETGLMIGRGVPLARSHRHFSHLLMFYPLHLLDSERPEERALIEKSLTHWINFTGALEGYSYTGAASMAACLGRRDEPARWLNEFLDRYVKPNTMYLEAGPVIETPLAGANTIQELLLQSWGDRMRIFPAVPDEWADVSFHKLRAEGAFLVSAARRAGRTQFVRVESLAGEPCRVRVADGGSAAFGLSAGPKVQMRRAADDVYEVDLRRGEAATLFAQGAELRVSPVAVRPERINYYGGQAMTARRASA